MRILKTGSQAQIDAVKKNVIDGLQWWEDLLAAQHSVHSLHFQIDFTYTDQPVQTPYEPISRPSDDFELWMDDFFDEAGVGGSDSYSDRIRAFNHQQRLTHETHWAFTIFVVNAADDVDHRFDPEGSFSQSFAFAGGRFFVTTSERPASSIAHETAHMFWAMDEYAGGKTYFDERGYYNTQNTNAFDGNPNPEDRVRSIMDSTGVGFAMNAVSPSALESIGWRDSDGNGIFDVLDVPHLLVGSGSFDPVTHQYEFEGFAQVQTLPNLNRSGTGHDMTIGQIDRVEVRYDGSAWQSIAEIGAYRADLQFSMTVPAGVQQIEVRAIDSQTGVSSNLYREVLAAPSAGWQNLAEPADVNDDSFITPLDALLIINDLNTNGPRTLSQTVVTPPPYLDVNGDGFLSPLDALVVINHLNTVSQANASTSTHAEGEPSEEDSDVAAAVLTAQSWCGLPNEGKRAMRASLNRSGRGARLDCIGPRRQLAVNREPNPISEPTLLSTRTVAHRDQLVDLVIADWAQSGGIGDSLTPCGERAT